MRGGEGGRFWSLFWGASYLYFRATITLSRKNAGAADDDDPAYRFNPNRFSSRICIGISQMRAWRRFTNNGGKSPTLSSSKTNTRKNPRVLVTLLTRCVMTCMFGLSHLRHFDVTVLIFSPRPRRPRRWSTKRCWTDRTRSTGGRCGGGGGVGGGSLLRKREIVDDLGGGKNGDGWWPRRYGIPWSHDFGIPRSHPMISSYPIPSHDYEIPWSKQRATSANRYRLFLI